MLDCLLCFWYNLFIMFVRIKTSPNSPKKAVQIVENIRTGNKVKQRIVRHVGTALTDDELEHLKNLAEFIKANIEDTQEPTIFAPEEMAEMAIQTRKKKEEEEEERELSVNLKALREEKRVVLGIHDVYGEIYKELGFNRVIPVRKASARNMLYHVVMGRVGNPESKMATVNHFEENFGINLSLSSVYRMMDTIDEKAEEKIKEVAWQSVNTLFSNPVRVVFYDLTTLYFESVTEDEIRDYGYSKDMKFNQVQVLLGILVTDKGLPIGYRVYNGSTYEGHTLRDAIEDLEKRYKIREVIFVADSGLLSAKNTEVLEEMKKEYILGARIKNLSEKIKKEIIKKETYTSVGEYAIKEIAYKGKRLIVTYSESFAKKDAQDRQRAIEKLLKKKNTKDLISNYGYKKYIKVNGDAIVELDIEKVERDRLFDGIHGVITNNTTLSAEEIVRQYHGLYQVEDTFRVTKHDIKIRPIFHWSPRRIKSHIAICFMALTLIRHLQYRMYVLGKPMSAERIRRALMSVQLSILKDIKTKQRYAIPSSISNDANEIYKAVGLKLSNIPYQIK